MARGFAVQVMEGKYFRQFMVWVKNEYTKHIGTGLYTKNRFRLEPNAGKGGKSKSKF
jgi:hypothetical protein